MAVKIKFNSLQKEFKTPPEASCLNKLKMRSDYL